MLKLLLQPQNSSTIILWMTTSSWTDKEDEHKGNGMHYTVQLIPFKKYANLINKPRSKKKHRH